MPFLLRSSNRKSASGASSLNTASIDFVNGAYTVHGASLTAADVVSDTGRISGSGLSILSSGSGTVSLLGDLRDLLFTGDWTVVVEVDVLAPESSSHTNYFIQLNDDATYYTIIDTTNQEAEIIEWDSDSATERSLFPTVAGVTGVNKIAVTRTSSLLAVSMNGAVADTAVQAFPDLAYVTALAAFHDATDPAGHIRSIDVLRPVAASDLPALSTIS